MGEWGQSMERHDQIWKQDSRFTNINNGQSNCVATNPVILSYKLYSETSPLKYSDEWRYLFMNVPDHNVEEKGAKRCHENRNYMRL